MKLLFDKRKKLGYTQQYVASRVGISRQFFSMIETDERRPSVEVAKKIAHILGFENEWYRLLESE